jgi:hypothetical protein
VEITYRSLARRWAEWKRGATLTLESARTFLPRKREMRSYGCHMSDPDH